jgi:prepilin-type N-terminal cleavage/methylation domain-containing protein
MKIRSDQRGITFIELMTVVAVIGIMAAMAVPSFLTYMPKLRVKAAARDVVSQLRLARSKAVAERRPFGVAFNVGNGSVITFADTDDPGSQSYSVSDSVIRTDTVSQDVALNSCTYANNCVVFNSTGAASTSGDLQVVTGDGSIIMSINVLASTGRVRLSELGT